MCHSELERIIYKALEKNRNLRYRSAADMRTDLQRLKRDTSVSTLHTVGRASLPAIETAATERRPTKKSWPLDRRCCYYCSTTGCWRVLSWPQNKAGIAGYDNIDPRKIDRRSAVRGHVAGEGPGVFLRRHFGGTAQSAGQGAAASCSGTHFVVFFKGKQIRIPEIARQLHVANVLEGSVRKSGDQVRITAQLIHAADGFHLWSQT